MQAFREGLPIFQYKQKIENSLVDNSFLIVTGDTGSGKSTQLPQYMLDSLTIKQNIIQAQAEVLDYANGDRPPITM